MLLIIIEGHIKSRCHLLALANFSDNAALYHTVKKNLKLYCRSGHVNVNVLSFVVCLRDSCMILYVNLKLCVRVCVWVCAYMCMRRCFNCDSISLVLHIPDSIRSQHIKW